MTTVFILSRPVVLLWTLNDLIKLQYSALNEMNNASKQVSSSQNSAQIIESVPGSLLAGAGKMVGTIHQVKAVNSENFIFRGHVKP